MDGQPKKPTLLNIFKQKHKDSSQQSPTPADPQPLAVDIDQLAKDKVEEIEVALKNLTALKLDVWDNWFNVLKQIITSADLHRTNDGSSKEENVQSNKSETGDCIYADYSDDNEQLGSSLDLSEQFATNSVKWTIRVHAFKIVHRLVSLLFGNINKLSAPALTKLLSDLVRLAFVAATSPYDELKMQGFEMFKFLIQKFAAVEEKEFPGHSILEQYKTQVLSAVKPAFNLDAPPYITAVASQICSLWICHGLEREPDGVKRTYQIMLLSIEKLIGQGTNQHSKLYTESELEQERVDILGSWAQLAIASKESNFSEKQDRLFRLTEDESTYLGSLIKLQIESLIDRWWEALKDFALLIMPSPKFIGTIHDNENVYTREVALKLFEPIWSKLVLAQTYCLVEHPEWFEADKTKYVQFLCGIILRDFAKFSLITSQSGHSRAPESTKLVLKALHIILSKNDTKTVFQDNMALVQEFHSVLYQIAIQNFAETSIKTLLEASLDALFMMAFEKVSKEESCIHYAAAKFVSLLMQTMRHIDIACKQESHSDIKSLKLQLTLFLRFLLMVIKQSPSPILDEAPLQEALITVFQEMLKFGQEKSVSSSLIDQLDDLYPILTETKRIGEIDKLYPEFLSNLKKLMQEKNDIKTEIDVKNEKQAATKNEKPRVSTKPRTAKITLKTDFSNFYATKGT